MRRISRQIAYTSERVILVLEVINMRFYKLSIENPMDEISFLYHVKACEIGSFMRNAITKVSLLLIFAIIPVTQAGNKDTSSPNESLQIHTASMSKAGGYVVSDIIREETENEQQKNLQRDKQQRHMEKRSLRAGEQKVAIVFDGTTQTIISLIKLRKKELANYALIIPIRSEELLNVEEMPVGAVDDIYWSFQAPNKLRFWGGVDFYGKLLDSALIGMNDPNIFQIKVMGPGVSPVENWLNMRDYKGFEPKYITSIESGGQDIYFIVVNIGLMNYYKQDFEFIQQQKWLKYCDGLEVKVTKVFDTLYKNSGQGTLAEQVSNEILQQKPFDQSVISSNPLNQQYNILSQHEYEELVLKNRTVGKESRELEYYLQDKFWKHPAIDKFHRIRDVLSTLERGLPISLKISFDTSELFIPIGLTKAQSGKTIFTTYVFSQEPLRDKEKTFNISEWRSLSTRSKAKLSQYLPVYDSKVVSILRFVGDSNMLEKDVFFKKMNPQERSMYSLKGLAEAKKLENDIIQAVSQDNLEDVN